MSATKNNKNPRAASFRAPDPFTNNTLFHSGFTESSGGAGGGSKTLSNYSVTSSGSVDGAYRRQSIAVKRNSHDHTNSMNLTPVELIPEPSFGRVDPFRVSNPNLFTGMSSDFSFGATGSTNNKSNTSRNYRSDSSTSQQQKKQPSLLSSAIPFTSAGVPTMNDSRNNSPSSRRSPSLAGGSRRPQDDLGLDYSPLFKERTYLSESRYHHRSSSTKKKPPAHEVEYNEEKRRGIIQHQVDAAKKRQLGVYTARALDATASSKAKTTPKNVGLAEARRLHDADSVASKLSIGPKHCQVKTALKWLSKLSGDPVEEKKREARRAAEIANAQIARRRMSECESERRLLSLTQSMKNELATFLNHLLDWASSGSAIVGRRNETERQLAETVANRENATRGGSALQQQQNDPTAIFTSVNHSGGGLSSVILGRGRGLKKKSSLNDGSSASTIMQKELSPDEQEELAHQSSWSFLRASSKAAGNALLTVDAFAVLKSFFDLLDADGSGSLTLDEIEAAARLIGREESQLVAAMKTVDKDQSGAIDFVEIVKVFFPTLSLSQISRFERNHREEIAKRMDPRVRMDPEDIKDIEETYQLLAKMPNGGCTFENMLSLMSDYMKEHSDIVSDAFYLYDADHNGHLTAEEFFDFMKFSYPPYSFRGVATKDEEAHAKKRSLISTEQQREEEELEERKKKHAQAMEAEKKRKQQQQQDSNGGGSNVDLMASVRNDEALASGVFPGDHHQDEASTRITHTLPKKMIVPNPPKTGLGTNPNSIASSWSTGNLALVAMERQKDREKRERFELRALRKKQKELTNTHASSSGGVKGTKQSAGGSGGGGASGSAGNNLNSTSNSTAAAGNHQNNSSKNRRTSMGVRSSSTSDSRGRSSSTSMRSPSSSSLSGAEDTTSTHPGGGDGDGHHHHKKRRRHHNHHNNDDDDSDVEDHESFSLEALSDARWKVVREGLNRDPAALKNIILLGTRDLPPVDSLKHRYITEHFRKHGTIPEIASARNLMLMARDDIEKERRAAEERSRFETTALKSARRNRVSSSPHRRPHTARSPSQQQSSAFDLIAKATTNSMNSTVMSSTMKSGAGSPLFASQRRTQNNNNNQQPQQSPLMSQSTTTPGSARVIPSPPPPVSQSTMAMSSSAFYNNNNNNSINNNSFASTASPGGSFRDFNNTNNNNTETMSKTHSTTTTSGVAPRQRNDVGAGGVEVDVETAKAASAMFTPKISMTKRLEKTLGGEYFTAGGEFSPERVHRSKQTVLMLEKIKSKIVERTPKSERY